jgi:hypothetical protein
VTFRTTTLVLAAFLAGCGGSAASPDGAKDEPTPHASAPAGQAAGVDFLTDARRVCARLEPRMKRLGTPATPPTDEQLLAALDVWELTLDELRRLKPPAAESKRFRSMLVHFDLSMRAARELPAAEGELSLVPVAVMADQGQKGAAIAQRLGLAQCSAFARAPSDEEFKRYVLAEAKKTELLRPPRARKGR